MSELSIIESDKLTDQLFEDLQAGKITREEYNKSYNQIMARTNFQYAVKEKPPVTPYRPTSNVTDAYVRAYRKGIDQRTQAGESIEEATRNAKADVDRIVKPTTMSYDEYPEIGLSRIVDVEKGLVRDANTGEIRPAESGELAAQAFLRQRIGTQEEVEQAYQRRKEQERRDSLERQKQAELAKKPVEDYGTLDYLTDTYLGLRYNYGNFWGDVAEEAKADALDVVEPFLMADIEAGDVYETPLGTALRDLTAMDAYRSSVYVEPFMQQSLFGNQDIYKVAESGDRLDQFAVNLVNVQSLPELYQSNEAITDLIGEDWAWRKGFAEEIVLPMTPIPGVKLLAKTTRGVTRSIAKSAAPDLITSPYEYAKYRQATKVVDDMFEQAGLDAKAKDIEFTPKTKEEKYAAEARRNNLNNVASEKLAEHLAVLNTVRATLDAGQDIPIKDLGAIAQTPTGVAIISNAMRGGKTAVLTRKNSGAYVTSVLDKYKQAAKNNADVARIYNESQAIQKQVSEAIQKSGNAQRVRTDNLTSFFESEIVRNTMAKLINEGKLTTKQVQAVITNKAKKAAKKGELLSFEKFTQLFDASSKLVGIEDIFLAAKNTLKVPIRERLLNFMPSNLSVVAGDTVVSVGKLNKSWNNKNIKAYQNRLKSFNSKIKYNTKTEQYDVGGSVKGKLLKDVIDYYGADRIRQSKGLRQLLSDISDGRIAFHDRLLVDNAIKSNSAIKHLDGFRLREGGEQYKRAIKAEEFKEDVFDLSRSENIFAQLARGKLGQITSDVKNLVKSILKGPRTKLVQGVNNPIEFETLVKEINNIEETVVRRTFEKYQEYIKASKGENKEVQALDKLGLDSSEAAQKSQADIIEYQVDRGFGGSWLDFAKSIAQEEGHLNNIIRKINSGMDPKTVVLDYALYFTKVDAWRSILARYVGPTKMSDIEKNLQKLLKKSDIEDEGFETFASARLDITYTNLLKVADRLIDLKPDTKFLRTRILGKETPLAPYMEYVIGVRRGQEVSKAQKTFIDRNPSYRLDYYPKYTNMEDQLNLAPLAAQYTKVFENIIEQLRSIGYKIDFDMETDLVSGLEKDMLGTLGDTFADIHYDVVNKVYLGQRTKIVDKIVALIEEKGNLLPNKQSMEARLSVILSQPKSVLDKQVNRLIDDLVKRYGGPDVAEVVPDEVVQAQITDARKALPPPRDTPKQLREFNISGLDNTQVAPVGTPKRVRQLTAGEEPKVKGEGKPKKRTLEDIKSDARKQVWDIFFDPPPVDGYYYGNPSMSLMQDITDNIRQFYRANGIAVDNKFVTTLNGNQPTFQAIKNTPYATVFGNKEKKMYDELADMSKHAKLREMMNTLRKADEGAAENIMYFVLDSISYAKRMMTQGMLAGMAWAPGTRYTGVNIFSAPFIAMGTVGLGRTFNMSTLALQRLGRSMTNKAITVAQTPPNQVLFTSKGGREYTAGELLKLESRMNLGMTRGQVEFYDQQFKEGLAGTFTQPGLDMQGKVKGKVRKGLSEFNPANRNMWSRINDDIDMSVRRAAFYSALQQDIPLRQAQDIAQRTLLNYGAMSKSGKFSEKEFFNRYFMFWSFTRQITAEFFNNFYKAVVQGGGAEAVLKSFKASVKQQEEAGTWLNGDDSMHKRMYAFIKDKEDGRNTYTFGMENPYAQSFAALTSIALIAASDDKIKLSTEFLLNARNRPTLEMIKNYIKDTAPSAPPAEVVYAAKAMGQWDWLKQKFNIVPRDIDKRRIQDPTFDEGLQYEFYTKNDAKNFQYWMYVLTVLGQSRAIRDYSKAGMAAEFPQEGTDVKRYGQPNPLLYLPGLETNLKVRDIYDISIQNQNKVERDLRSLYNEIK